MNKQLVIGLGVIVVLGAGYFAYTKLGNKESIAQNPYMNNGNSSEVETTNPNTKKMAFGAFVKQGGSYACTVHQSVNNIDSTGTIYVANGNMSGQFDTTVQGTKMTSYMIMKDGYMYSWSSASPMGFKMAISASSETGNTCANGSYGYDASQIGDYDCQPWTADSAKFTAPASVKFTEMKSASIN